MRVSALGCEHLLQGFFIATSSDHGIDLVTAGIINAADPEINFSWRFGRGLAALNLAIHASSFRALRDESCGRQQKAKENGKTHSVFPTQA